MLIMKYLNKYKIKFGGCRICMHRNSLYWL